MGVKVELLVVSLDYLVCANGRLLQVGEIRCHPELTDALHRSQGCCPGPQPRFVESTLS